MHTSHNKGIALLIAVLVSSIALAIGIGIHSIFFREIRIVRNLAPSLVAHYRSEAGAECAQYWWHFSRDVFDITQPNGSTVTIECFGKTLIGTFDEPNKTYTFNELGTTYTPPRVDFPDGSCVFIQVIKKNSSHPNCAVGGPAKRVNSFGRTNCNGTGSQLQVDRGTVFRNPSLCPI